MQQEGHDNKELCINGCGFFGASASGGMCSVCWKKTMSNQQAQAMNPMPAAATVSAQVEKPFEEVKNVETSTEAAVAVAAAEEEEEKAEKKPVQKNKKRCWECKKKVGYTGIECRCGYVFCGSHRYEDQHACSFDYKTSGREVLAKQNPGGGAFVKLDKL